ncbi:Rrf2 family transcriptional regulator [Acidovorax sp. 1608163]|uniref:Rrf2 family transcriptional regulator n=1 Tax=Acidovorax sp. 1608163 TaxID=2478662 RepID=UPI000EF72F1E|nr:Rrf2 family transcriptional regulator [Acidovorax sp. 1608163]AYM95114.1 Rrf2 family transcriptional regulator [Acidovorax sp. 1608163]
MRITTRGKVAVSAMTDLALHQRMKPVSLTTISQRQGTSLSYLEQLFSALRRAGLVESTRGPGGGYALARRAEQIAVAEIILAVENMDVDDYQPLTAPQVAQLKAMTGELWVSFNARVLEYLQSVSLKDLMEQAQAQGVVTAPEPEAKTLRKTSGIAPVARPLMARLQIPNSVFALGALPLAPRR